MNENPEVGNDKGATQATGWLRNHSSRIMTSGIILAVLYLGRSVLIPLALAIMLSLLVAPLIRALRRLRIGRASSVLVAVTALTVSCAGIAAALGTQILHIAESLPQYETNVQRKLKTLEELTVRPILRLTNETSRLVEIRQSAEAPPVPAGDVERSPPETASVACGAPATGIRVPPTTACVDAPDNRLASDPIRRHRAAHPHLRATRVRISARPLHSYRRRDRYTHGHSCA